MLFVYPITASLIHDRLLLSGEFTFLIGKEKKPVVVHEKALSAISEPMKAMMNLPMSESESRCANIPDLEVEDFVRFCEYAYRGDYSVPQYHVRESSTANGTLSPPRSQSVEDDVTASPPNEAEDFIFDEPPNEAIPADDGWAPIVPKKKKETKKEACKRCKSSTSSRILRKKWQNREFEGYQTAKNEVLEQCVPVGNTSGNQDFTPVFLSHARLYRFAGQKLVGPLQALTLHKLHCTLKDFKLFVNRIDDVL